jgi:hypothetical protein
MKAPPKRLAALLARLLDGLERVEGFFTRGLLARFLTRREAPPAWLESLEDLQRSAQRLEALRPLLDLPCEVCGHSLAAHAQRPCNALNLLIIGPDGNPPCSCLQFVPADFPFRGRDSNERLGQERGYGTLPRTTWNPGDE